jgi:hypothetical protein
VVARMEQLRLAAGTSYQLNVRKTLKTFWNLKFFVPDIISTVGPRGENAEILQLAYTNCLNLMMENGLRTIVQKQG